jgi:hypothetical protein
MVRVVIGAPIPTAGRGPSEVNAEAKAWVDATRAALTMGAGMPPS